MNKWLYALIKLTKNKHKIARKTIKTMADNQNMKKHNMQSYKTRINIDDCVVVAYKFFFKEYLHYS